MKKIFILFLLMVLMAFPLQVNAEKRMVQLNLSGCADCNATARIDKILKKTKGVVKHVNKGHGVMIISFDDEITTLNIIINELKRGKLFVEGEPVFLK